MENVNNKCCQDGCLSCVSGICVFYYVLLIAHHKGTKAENLIKALNAKNSRQAINEIQFNSSEDAESRLFSFMQRKWEDRSKLLAHDTIVYPI